MTTKNDNLNRIDKEVIDRQFQYVNTSQDDAEFYKVYVILKGAAKARGISVTEFVESLLRMVDSLTAMLPISKDQEKEEMTKMGCGTDCDKCDLNVTSDRLDPMPGTCDEKCDICEEPEKCDKFEPMDYQEPCEAVGTGTTDRPVYEDQEVEDIDVAKIDLKFIFDFLTGMKAQLDIIERKVDERPAIASFERLEPAKLQKFKGVKIRKKDMKRINRMLMRQVNRVIASKHAQLILDERVKAASKWLMLEEEFGLKPETVRGILADCPEKLLKKVRKNQG